MSHGIRPTGFKVRIKAEKCINCGKCIKVCARRNFRPDADGTIVVVHLNNCNGCTKCRDVCATKAIAVAPDPMRGAEPPRPGRGPTRPAEEQTERSSAVTRSE